MKKVTWVLAAAISLASVLSACSAKEYAGDTLVKESYNQKQIRRVAQFSDFPQDYAYFDYGRKAREFDAVAFSFANNPDAYSNPAAHKALCYPDEPETWGPVGFFDNSRTMLPENNTTFLYKGMSFGLPTYVADRRTAYGAYEAITALPSLLGASYAGIDKAAQTLGGRTYNFVEMAKAYYDKNSKCVLNTVSSTEVGQSTWYALYPQVTFTRLYDLYRSDDQMKEIVLNGADAWLSALGKMKRADGSYDFEFMGFDMKSETPVYGGWVDPPCGAMAFLFYSAYEITGEQKYKDGVTEILDYLEDYERNPNYEAMTDYLPLVAAAMNMREGTHYNVAKYLDYLFENDSSVRGNWGMITGSYGGYPVDGLVGDMNYAFAMNTFNLASVMAPMVKYDTRYADAVGKYLLNVVNNAKWFFPQNVPLENQTMNDYLSFDPTGAICYEGFQNGSVPLAKGDAVSMFSQPCDLSLYSASHIGYLGGMTERTDVEGILRFDLNKTDSFGIRDFETYLYYNPYGTDKTVTLPLKEKCDVFNAVDLSLCGRNVHGEIKLAIPAGRSAVIKILPANSKFKITGDTVSVNGVTVGERQAAVNILSPDRSRYEMRQGDVFRFSYYAPKGDEVVNMKCYYGSTQVYDGAPVKEFAYSKAGLHDTDYQFKVVITTKQGRTDVASTRVVCL